MRVIIKLFGDEARIVGQRIVTLDLAEPVTCGAVRAAIEKLHPALGSTTPRCRFAVNHEFVADTRNIADGDEVALIGQVSGG